MTVLHDDAHLRLVFHSSSGICEAIWQGFLSGQELRQRLELLLKLAGQHQPTGWLADTRQMRTLRQADQDWIIQDLAPRFARLVPLQRAAVVESLDAMNLLSVKSVVQAVLPVATWQTRFFHTRLDAWEWLNRPLDAAIVPGTIVLSDVV